MNGGGCARARQEVLCLFDGGMKVRVRVRMRVRELRRNLFLFNSHTISADNKRSYIRLVQQSCACVCIF